MKPLSESRVFAWICIVFLIAVVYSILTVAYAGGDDIIQSNDPVTTQEVNVGGSGSAIGIGGADYDIGRGSCKYHVGGLTFAIAQTDEFCEGMDMIRMGMVNGGILHICKQSKVGKNYETLESCKTDLAVGLNLDGGLNGANDVPRGTSDDEDEHQEQYDALYARVSELEQKERAEAARAEKYAQKAREAARRAEQAPQTIIQQQEFIDDEKRAKLEALRSKK